MWVTQRTMERRVNHLEEQLEAVRAQNDYLRAQNEELRTLIMQRTKDRPRRSRHHHHKRRSTADYDGSDEDAGSVYSYGTTNSTRDSVRDFGGRKMKIPLFRGDDAYGWIVRTERYFKLNRVEEEEKLDAVVIALEDQALNWYQWWEEQNTDLTWDAFKEALVRRFQPGLVQNPFGPLLSVKQTESVMKYREQFEREAAPLKREERVMLKGIFLNGLKEEIQAELKLHGECTLDEMMDRALLLEEKNTAMKKGGARVEEKKESKEKGKPWSRWTAPQWEKGGNRSKSEGQGGDKGGNEKKSEESGRLSQAELRERSKKGLCFKCGEKWGHEHVCKLKHYKFQLVEDSESEKEVKWDTTEGEAEEVPVLQIKKLRLSMRSKEGLTSNRSFKTVGLVGGKEVLVLIDCGASSNFISKQLLDELKITKWDTPEYMVELGNGECVKSQGVCKNLEVIIQGVPITQHYFLLELGGTDLVLGMDWLESLGDIKANFRTLSLKWEKKGKRRCSKVIPLCANHRPLGGL